MNQVLPRRPHHADSYLEPPIQEKPKPRSKKERFVQWYRGFWYGTVLRISEMTSYYYEKAVIDSFHK